MIRRSALPAFDLRRWGTVLMILTGCAAPEQGRGPQATAKDALDLTAGISIGADSSGGPDYLFASISELLITSTGDVWIIDGSGGEVKDPQIRVFSRAGKFLRRVGRHGEGPGEYMIPSGLAELKDGRIVVRDDRQPSKIEVFSAEGKFIEDWNLPLSMRWGSGFAQPIQTDASGMLWLPTTVGRPGPDRPPPMFILLDDHGMIRDSTVFPVTPQIEIQKVELVQTAPGGGDMHYGWELPFQPRGTWAWNPLGHFAIARTDIYQIEMIAATTTRPVDGVRNLTLPRTLSRGEGPIAVTETERTFRRDFLRKLMSSRPGAEKLTIPEIAKVKPILNSIEFSSDGKLLVWVSSPAHLEGEEWVEPKIVDVFDPADRYLGRITFPAAFYPMRFRGDRVWGVGVGADNESFLQEYRINWP